MVLHVTAVLRRVRRRATSCDAVSHVCSDWESRGPGFESRQPDSKIDLCGEPRSYDGGPRNPARRVTNRAQGESAVYGYPGVTPGQWTPITSSYSGGI